jgi:hypothetical protein
MRAIVETIKQFYAAYDYNHILTDADDTAVPFYEKCDFSHQITLAQKYYQQYMGGVDGAQLMECCITNE